MHLPVLSNYGDIYLDPYIIRQEPTAPARLRELFWRVFEDALTLVLSPLLLCEKISPYGLSQNGR